MNIDPYTKTVLTVIAVALCVIVFQQGLGSAIALGDGCGGPSNPCYVLTAPNDTVEIRTGINRSITVEVRPF